MGKIMKGVFGGKSSKQTSHSENQAYDYLQNTFSPLTSQASTGANALSALLSGDSSGFDAYKAATGFDATAEEGSRGITNNAAANGLLRSGSTAKGLQAYGDTIQNQFAQNYLSNLFNQANLGLSAGNLISGAGQVSDSTGTSSEKPGIAGFLGKLGSGIAAG